MLSTLFHTLIHLKPIQAIYQLKNKLIKVGQLSSFQLPFHSTQKLDFFESPAIYSILKVESDQFSFEFLNLTRTYFKTTIDWNDPSHGKLWNYNLQYLDFLKQGEIDIRDKVFLINDIYSWLWEGRLLLEPYPVSLRIMNVVRFLNSNVLEEVEKKKIESFVLAEVNYLSKNLEYHLLANHLLENAFAWWMGALYFEKRDWIEKGGGLLKEQLDEQILTDGAHYELAPMYHQIILFRVLEAYYLTPNSYKIKEVLKGRTELMLGWMDKICFENGYLPHFNDTTKGITYSPNELQQMAESLGIFIKPVKLNESGYRVFETGSLKMVADVEGIKPSYQPGHAHADTFSFVLHFGGIPVIVDPGISTYNIGERRSWERSTLAHNTVTVDDRNSSDVWAGFRVGKRAKVRLIKDEKACVSAYHDGFGSQLHQRTFGVVQNGIVITDEILNMNSDSKIVTRFYLHPDIQPKLFGRSIELIKGLSIQFDGASDIEIGDYEFCEGYNKLTGSKFISVTISDKYLKTRFTLN